MIAISYVTFVANLIIMRNLPNFIAVVCRDGESLMNADYFHSIIYYVYL